MRSRRPGAGWLGWVLCPVLSLLVLVTGAQALSRRPDEPPGDPKPAPLAEPAPTSRFEGVELVGEDDDGTVWKLLAEEGWGTEAERSGSLRDVTATLRKGDHDVILEAQRARIEEGDAFHLYGGVLLRWGEFAARLDTANYLRHRGLITSDSPVLFTGPGVRLEGRGVTIELESRVVHIPSEARAVLGEEPT